jgi:hypothetical protein
LAYVHLSIDSRAGGLSPGLFQRGVVPINANHLISVLGQQIGMAPLPAAEI